MTALIFTIIWGFVWAVVTNVVAQSKGAGGCGWLILGFLLGPIGLIIAVVQPSRVLVPAGMTQQPQGPTRLCPHCRSHIPIDATVCRYCQRECEPPTEADIRPAIPPTCKNGYPHRWVQSQLYPGELACKTCRIHYPPAMLNS